MNFTQNSDPGIVREAHKTMIWGVLIKHGSRIKQDCEAELTKLPPDMHKLRDLTQIEPCYSSRERTFKAALTSYFLSPVQGQGGITVLPEILP